ncbi:MAG: methyltransferase domain-containing protein [Anaerolineales bacterium]|nr:methyltransferase domain-containing protein [Anaerolineales bacterium]
MKEKQAIKKFFTELSTHYEETMDGELKLFWGWSYQSFLEKLVNRTDIQKNQKILDIATGTSFIPRKIMEQNIPGIQITGLDITESMLRQANQKITAAEYQSSIRLTCADAMALPYKAGSFDVVVSGLASHHMDIPLMLTEMKRVLKPGGLLSIIDVGTSPLWETRIYKGIARLIAFFYFLIKDNPTRAWAEAAAVNNLRTPEGWEIDLTNVGFTTVKIKKLKSKYKWAPEPLSIQSSY